MNTSQTAGVILRVAVCVILGAVLPKPQEHLVEMAGAFPRHGGGGGRAVGGEGALRLRLLDMGLIPGTAVSVRKVAPLGDPIEIRIRGYELTLRLEDASYIELEDGGDRK